MRSVEEPRRRGSVHDNSFPPSFEHPRDEGLVTVNHAEEADVEGLLPVAKLLRETADSMELEAREARLFQPRYVPNPMVGIGGRVTTPRDHGRGKGI